MWIVPGGFRASANVPAWSRRPRHERPRRLSRRARVQQLRLEDPARGDAQGGRGRARRGHHVLRYGGGVRRRRSGERMPGRSSRGAGARSSSRRSSGGRLNAGTAARTTSGTRSPARSGACAPTTSTSTTCTSRIPTLRSARRWQHWTSRAGRDGAGGRMLELLRRAARRGREAAGERGTARFTVLQNEYNLLSAGDDAESFRSAASWGSATCRTSRSRAASSRESTVPANPGRGAPVRPRDRPGAPRAGGGARPLRDRSRTHPARPRDLGARLDPGHHVGHRRGDEAGAGAGERGRRALAPESDEQRGAGGRLAADRPEPASLSSRSHRDLLVGPRAVSTRRGAAMKSLDRGPGGRCRRVDDRAAGEARPATLGPRGARSREGASGCSSTRPSSTRIDNPFWPMRPGSRWVYRGDRLRGARQRVVVTVTKRTKVIANGVRARVVRDVVTEDGEPVEVTDDWYAQDRCGNVWYLGEATKENRQRGRLHGGIVRGGGRRGAGGA